MGHGGGLDLQCELGTCALERMNDAERLGRRSPPSSSLSRRHALGVSQIWLRDIGMRIFMTAGPIFSGLVDGASYGALVAADSRVRFSSGLGQLGGQA